MSLMIEIRMFFRKQKKLFDLRVEVYKKLVIEEENLKFEKSVGETVNLKNQKDILSETPQQKEFIEYIENKSKTIVYNLFKNYFDFSVPSALLKQLYKTKKRKTMSQQNKSRIDGVIQKMKLKKCLKMKEKLKNQMKYQKLLKKFLFLIEKTTRFRFKNFNTKPNAQNISNYYSSIKSRKEF